MKQITKEIKDYLPYYIGCDVVTPDGIGKLVGLPWQVSSRDRVAVHFGSKMVKTKNSIDGGYNKTRNHGEYLVTSQHYVAIAGTDPDFDSFDLPGGVKPILRKLSSMTEEEARDIAVIMFGQPDSVKWRLESKTNYLNVYRKHYHISFTIDLASGDVDIYDDGEIQTTINHHFITKYLLSKGFDLFGLIESGLALDKDNL